MYIYHADEMNKLDEYAIKHIGIPQCVLMERAAMGVVECMVNRIGELSGKKVLVLSGPGNCGGDGLATARNLLDRGIKADVYMPVSVEKCKESVQLQAGLFSGFGGRILNELPDEEYDIYVDALFGVGLNRAVGGAFYDAVSWLNKRKDNATESESRNENKNENSKDTVFSIDIPSGIHTDTGAVMEIAVKADCTVTFSFLKPGLLLYPGHEYAGKIYVSSIGIDSLSVPGLENKRFAFERSEAGLKKRKADGNKGTFHRIFVIAGSSKMPGAAVLCAGAALRSGAGLVELYTHKANRDIVLTSFPEVILQAYEDDLDPETLKDAMSRADSVVLGPGLSMEPVAKQIVKIVLESCEKPLLIDADGLNLIASDENLKKILCNRSKRYLTVLTPHPGELSRLMNESVAELLSDYEASVKNAANAFHSIVVGKGANSLVSDGESVYYNLSGNDGMATAGSGDVLAGMAGTFLVNEETAFKGICLAVYHHGLAGEAASELWGKRSVTAADLWKGILDS